MIEDLKGGGGSKPPAAFAQRSLPRVAERRDVPAATCPHRKAPSRLGDDYSDWSGWSIAQLEEAAGSKGPLCINDVVYAELSVRYARIVGFGSDARHGGRYRTYFPRMALIAPEKCDLFICKFHKLLLCESKSNSIIKYLAYQRSIIARQHRQALALFARVFGSIHLPPPLLTVPRFFIV